MTYTPEPGNIKSKHPQISEPFPPNHHSHCPPYRTNASERNHCHNQEGHKAKNQIRKSAATEVFKNPCQDLRQSGLRGWFRGLILVLRFRKGCTFARIWFYFLVRCGLGWQWKEERCTYLGLRSRIRDPRIWEVRMAC